MKSAISSTALVQPAQLLQNLIFRVTSSKGTCVRSLCRSWEGFEQVLGTDELNAYLNKYRLELDPHLAALVGRHSRKPWTKFINAENQRLAVPEAIDFLDKLLRYDQHERPTVKEAMAHPYFYPVRNAESSKTRA